MSDLTKIDVSAHTEKKNNLSYLSWAWAWTKVLEIDPQATWEAVEFNGLPVAILPDESAMVKVLVTIKGHTKSCWLPVMNHRNQAIKGPDAFAINTAIVRCLTKAISMHGLGLYIYAGEDLPEQAPEAKPQIKSVKVQGGLSEVADNNLLGRDMTDWLAEIATFITDMVHAGEAEAAKAKLAEYELDDTQNLYMQSCIKDPKVKKALGFVWVKSA